MRIGPVTPLDIDQLRDVLERHQIQFEEFTTDEIKEQIAQTNRERPPTQNTDMRYDGPVPMIFLEIPDNAQAIVKPVMEKLGYWHENASDGSELDGDDYYCLQCEHHSLHAGICPTHHTPLLASETFRQQKEASRKSPFGVLMNLFGINTKR